MLVTFYIQKIKKVFFQPTCTECQPWFTITKVFLSNPSIIMVYIDVAAERTCWSDKSRT